MISDDENLLRTKCADVAKAIFYHNNYHDQRCRLESALVTLAQFLRGDDARLVAENAMPVEDDDDADYAQKTMRAIVVAHSYSEAEADRWLKNNEQRTEKSVHILQAYGDKRTAALQAELDRANGLLDRIVHARRAQYTAQSLEAIDATLAQRASSPVASRPAVVITAKERDAWTMLKGMRLNGEHVVPDGLFKVLNPVFAERSS